MAGGRNALARSIALPRLRAQPGVLVAVVASVVVATTLLATGPVLAAALAEGGLRARLEQSPPREIGIEVEVRTTAATAAAAADVAVGAVVARLGELVEVPDVLVETGTVQLAGIADDVVLPVGILLEPTGSLDDHGAPPPLLQPAGGGEVPAGGGEVPVGGGVVAVRLHEAALDRLDLDVGDRVDVEGGVTLEVVGALSPRAAADRRWWDDDLWRDGVEVGESFTSVGPIVPVDPDALGVVIGEPDPRVVVTVRTLPALDAVRPDRLVALRDATRDLRLDLADALVPLASRWRVEVPLADAAVASTVRLASTRAAVLATVAQVAVLALYTLGLSGRLLRSGREVETMLVRARGATPGQLGRAAFVEGLVVVVPAVLVAPWTGTVLTALLGRLDVVAGAGLVLDPRPSVAAAAAAVVAGVACLGMLVWPAVTAARRTYAAARGDRGRRRIVSLAQSSGLDLALVVVAAVGIWQLRAAGGPLGDLAPQDPGELDVVLVAAPALGLLAGAVLVLRFVPMLAAVGEHLVSRGRGLVGSLSGWQVARRPQAVSRPTLLLVLGVAIGVLATTYARTWDVAQDDQAAAAVGAEAVARADLSAGSLLPSAAAATIADLEGVEEVAATLRSPVRLVPGAPVGTVVAVDAAEPLLLSRADTAPSIPVTDIDVPPLPGVPIPSGDDLSVTAAVTRDPAWPSLGTALTFVVRDGDGLVHRLPERPLPPAGDALLEWDLRELRRPAVVVAIEVVTESGAANGAGSALVPAGTTDPELLARLTPPVVAVSLATPTVDGRTVTLDQQDWVTEPPAPSPVALVPATLDRLGIGATGVELRGTTGIAPPLARTVEYRATYRGAAERREDAFVPAIVHDDVLSAIGRLVGEEVGIQVLGVPLRLRLVGTAPVVPGAVDETLPVLVDVDALSAARWQLLRAPTRAEAWQLDLAEVGGGDVAALERNRTLAARLAAGEIRSPGVETVVLDAAGRSADPIAVGLLVALALGSVAAVLLALLGTITAAAVSVRERSAEFALLQAVGTSMRQLRWWLTCEIAVVVVTGLLAGALLGAALVWAVLPTIGLATDGSIAVPAPRVVVPVRLLVASVTVVVATFAIVPLGLARSVARAHVAEVLRLGEDA